MVATLVGDEAIIAKLHAKLLAGTCTLTQKYRILYSLRSCSNESAHQALITALKDDSALFRHDVAFALGQREDPAAVDTLKRVLFDAQEHCMVRHEAAEALGAIGTAGCLEPLQQCEHDSMREVSETCQLARQRMEFVSSHEAVDAAGEGSYQSVDPTPPYPASMATDEVAAILLDDEHCLFDRYRALFALRNRGGTGAVQVLEQCFQPGNSALLKHEVAYVLGQMMDKQSVTCLKRVLLDPSEHAMVRHEAAEALGAIADEDCIQLLQDRSTDPEPIVADSCIVALDMIAHERSGAFEYADMGHEA